MSDIKFSCPQCGQHITCDELWMGQQLACPSCHANLTVPQMAAAPAAVPAPAAPAGAPESLVPNVPGGAQPRLSINRTVHHQSPLSPPATPFTPGAQRGYAPPQPEKKSKVASILTWTALLAVVGVGLYFGFQWLLRFQAATNAKLAEQSKNSGGGEMGETASLYKALDATDPDKMRSGSVPGFSRLKRHESAANTTAAADEAEEKESATPQPDANAPVVPAPWTLDLNAAQIPVSRVNGTISGTPFIAGTVRLDVTPTAQVLRFTQGDLTSPDREVLIYFHFTPSDTPAGKTITIATDTHGPTNPGLVKRWKATPQSALQSKSFPSGYAMQIQFGAIANGQLTGKIYLALPDPEKTVIAGIFNAATNLK